MNKYKVWILLALIITVCTVIVFIPNNNSIDDIIMGEHHYANLNFLVEPLFLKSITNQELEAVKK